MFEASPWFLIFQAGEAINAFILGTSLPNNEMSQRELALKIQLQMEFTRYI
jgi:hypothetical protein